MAGMSERGQKRKKKPKNSSAEKFFIIDGLFPACHKTLLYYTVQKLSQVLHRNITSHRSCRGKSAVPNGNSLETDLPAKRRILYIASIAEKKLYPVMKTD